MPRFSILLPTLRGKLFDATLYSIRLNSVAHDYEIVVVSPFPVHGDRIIWVEEREQRGSINAFLLAYQHSSGDIIIVMTDDSIVLPGWLDAVDHWITEGETQHFPYCIGLNWCNPPGVCVAFGRYFANLPALSRRSIEACGGLFDPSFKASWADPDLGMRIWASGGRVEYCPEARVAFSRLQQHFRDTPRNRETLAKDADLFWRKWNSLVPEGQRWTQFNDVTCGHSPNVVKDRTVLLVPEINRTGKQPATNYKIYDDLMGFQAWRRGYPDGTTDVLLVAEQSFGPVAAGQEFAFLSLSEAIDWIVTEVMKFDPKRLSGVHEWQKLHTAPDDELSQAIVAAQIEGAHNCRNVQHRTWTWHRRLSVSKFDINGQPVYVGSRLVDTRLVTLGALIHARFSGYYVSRDRRGVIAAIVDEARRERPAWPPAFPGTRLPLILLFEAMMNVKRAWRRILSWPKSNRIDLRQRAALRSAAAIYDYEMRMLVANGHFIPSK